MSRNELDNFTRQYLETILFAETDNSTPSGGEPLDKNYSVDNFAAEAVAKAKADGEQFLAKVKAELPFVIDEAEETSLAHDFWLTRRGHGAGFWDGDYDHLNRDGIDVGDKLTEIAKTFRDQYVYVGDDGKLYVENG